MITISPEAQEFLCGIECPEGKVLRLEATLEASGKHDASFKIGYPKHDDELLRREGETLLHVSRLACKTFDGFVVTRLEERGGVGITLSPPYAGKFSW
jgi:hypothetical protein